MVDRQSKLTLVKFNKQDLSLGRHILIVESTGSRRAVALNVNVFSIGRHPHNNLVISDRLASRHHATIAWMRYVNEAKNKQDYGYWIIDGKGKRKRSRNGIYINGTQKPLHRLVEGDIITIGDDIKITYNYIAYNTETHQFLEDCEHNKAQYNSAKETNYKETVTIEFPQS